MTAGKQSVAESVTVSSKASDDVAVLTVRVIGIAPLQALFARYDLAVSEIADNTAIPGSYWGESEAGLLKSVLYLRSDTPLHSVLHEACHYICMDATRRAQLNRDAGGDYAEEDAVCYLQLLLSEQLPGVSRERMCADMDAWGYTFRLGSARAWFEQDADLARQWLIDAQLIDELQQPTWRLRQF